jgi:inorganic pyrophosphatase
MQDYEKLYDFGETNNFIYTVCEIPKGSTHKVEFIRDKKVFELDRVEPLIFAKPVSYGFIPQTTDEDEDPLDTLIITDEPVSTGVVVKARVIGLLKFVDQGENDHKILCVPEDDRNSGDAIKNLSDLNEQLKKQIEHHFTHYKDLKSPGTTKVEGWGDAAAAWEIIAECVNRYKQN